MAKLDIGAAFRAMHHGDKAFVIPNAWDVRSDKLLEGLGFKALATTSSGLAVGIGKRDGGTTLDDVIAHCRDLVEASDLPVSADLEKGMATAQRTLPELSAPPQRPDLPDAPSKTSPATPKTRSMISG
jgi:2-methylisocitrate lyase-like PEP mutase family enzyme